MKRIMNCKGYTLVELVVVMAIFIIIMIISTSAFENILKRSGQQGKSAESEISGIVGLEMMRADIAAAGYGLPWVFQALPTSYNEITDGNLPASNVLSTADFDNLRDVPTDLTKVPRALASATGSSTSNSGIDYLVVKGALLGMNQTARRWNYVNYSSSTTSTNISYLSPRGDPTTDLANLDRVITIQSLFTTTGTETKQLMVNAGAFQYVVPLTVSPNPGPIPVSDAFKPVDKSQMLVAYGINSDPTNALRMPYNRVDYYVDKTAAKPASCSFGTGVLYKALADHLGGFVNYPMLDCVGDMKIRYDRDQNNDGNIILADAAAIGAMTAADIRSQIKNVRVYILAHEGKKDPSFSYPVKDANNVICVGPYQPNGSCSSSGRSWKQTELATTFGADWLHYRWKVYYFVVNLKNLQQ